MKNKHARALGSMKSDRKTAAARQNGKRGGRPPHHGFRHRDLPYDLKFLSGKLRNFAYLFEPILSGLCRQRTPLTSSERKKILALAHRIEAWRISVRLPLLPVKRQHPRLYAMRRDLLRDDVEAAMATATRLPDVNSISHLSAEEQAAWVAERAAATHAAADELESGPPPPPGG